MLRAIIGLVVVATVVGAMMPAGDDGERTPANQAQAEPWFDKDGSTAMPNPNGGWASSNSAPSEVRLTRHSNGHFYADVEVNGTTVEFMIDTGATGIAMTAADAQRVGITLDPSEQEYVGQGAGGALTGQQVTLSRVRLGERTATDMEAVVINGATTNLLGQSFLSRFPEISVRGDVMTLQ